MLEIYPTPNPTLNLPDSVDKCKPHIKTYLLKQTMLFELPYTQIWTVLSNRSLQNKHSVTSLVWIDSYEP